MYAVDIGDHLAVQTADDLPVRYAAALAPSSPKGRLIR